MVVFEDLEGETEEPALQVASVSPIGSPPSLTATSDHAASASPLALSLGAIF